MSKQARIWLVVAILHTIYLFFTLGQGAIGLPDAWTIYVFPFGEFPMVGDSSHLGYRDFVIMIFLSVSLTWVIWGWNFVEEGTWKEHRIRRDGMTNDR